MKQKLLHLIGIGILFTFPAWAGLRWSPCEPFFAIADIGEFVSLPDYPGLFVPKAALDTYANPRIPEFRTAARYAKSVRQNAREVVLLLADIYGVDTPAWDGIAFNQSGEPTANLQIKSLNGGSAATGKIAKSFDKVEKYMTLEPWRLVTRGQHLPEIATIFGLPVNGAVARATRFIVDLQNGGRLPLPSESKRLQGKLEARPHVLESVIYLKKDGTPFVIKAPKTEP